MSNSLTYQGRAFTDSELVSGSSYRTQPLDMRNLAIDTASFILRPIIDRDFFTHEPYPMFTRDLLRFKSADSNPLSDGVVQNAAIKQYIDGSQVALWHARSIERLDKEKYKISVVSPLGLLAQRTHYGGIYTGQTLKTVVDDLMGGISHYIAPEFQTIPLYGWLPIASARDNLMQVLFASNAALTTDANGVLRIENLSTTASMSVAKSDIYASGASVRYDTPVTSIVVLEHSFVVGSETRKLFDGTTVEGQLITFSEPVSDLQASGFTIRSSGANYAVLSSGSGTVTGVPYVDTTREIRRAVTSATPENEVRIERATLVNITASADVADRLQEYHRHRNSIKVSVAGKVPKSGTVVRVVDPYTGETVTACVASDETAISGVSKTGISALVGYTPWQTVPFSDNHIILTGSGSWTVPSGVTQVSAVLIGAGGGGSGGGNGRTGGSGSPGSQTVSFPGTASFSGGAGGAGGGAGTAGTAGKILRLDLTVSGGQVFAYSCGAAGAAGTANGGAGGAGGDTMFGSYSSSSGAVSASGYTDTVTGTRYALPGSDGFSGASGGSGSSGTGSGSAGGDAQGRSGGRGGTGASGSQDWPDVRRYTGGGAGGGGASANASGEPGGNGTYGTSGSGGTLIITGATGGNGGAGSAGASAVSYGSAGSGGNGGGGGGGAGGTSYYWEPPNSGHETLNVRNSSSGGSGGAGGAGGAGAAGCIILVYRSPDT